MNSNVTPWLTSGSAYQAGHAPQTVVLQLLTLPQDRAKDSKWDSVINSITNMQLLKSNWDGNGATPPSGSLIRSVIELATHLKSRHNLPPTRVSPIVDGGIALEWQVGDKFYHWEFLLPYLAEAFTSIPGAQPKFEEIDFKGISAKSRDSHTNQLRDKWIQPQTFQALLSRPSMCTAGF